MDQLLLIKQTSRVKTQVQSESQASFQKMTPSGSCLCQIPGLSEVLFSSLLLLLLYHNEKASSGSSIKSLWCLRQFPQRVLVWILVKSAALRPEHPLIKCTLVPDLARKTSIFPCLSYLFLSSLASKPASLCFRPSFLSRAISDSSFSFPSFCLWLLLVTNDCHPFPM